MFTTAITHKMSFKIVSKKYAKLNSTYLKHVSTRVDNYRSAFVYYSFKSEDFDNIVNGIKEDVKCPCFKGDIGEFTID